MTEPRTNILPSDIDAQGNVTLWDHGPQEPKTFPHDTPEQASARAERQAALAKAWHDEHGDMAQPMIMHSGDAGHAMTVEPGRYALEPGDIDEGEIEKRMLAMKEKREAALNAPQLAIDRKAAIAEIMSERRAEITAAAVEQPDPPPAAPWHEGDTLNPPEEKPVV